MNKKFVWLITSCLMVAALVLASCAPAVVEEKKATVVTKEAEKKAEEVEEVVEKVGPQYGGIATAAIPWGGGLTSFDWADNIGATTFIMSYTHDQLMKGDWYLDRDICDYRFSYAWKANPATWWGSLAESWEWTDTTTLVLHLREGVHWQNKPPLNGREFVADDVVKNFERLLAAPRLAGDPRQAIKTVVANDKHTVTLTMHAPNSEITQRLMETLIAATDCLKEFGGEYDDLRSLETLIGTGPFTLEDYLPASSITLKRNPIYWDKDPRNGNQLPYVDGVKLLVIEDMSTIIAALKTGKIDMANYISWQQQPVLAAFAPELSWETNPGKALFSMWFKNSIEPFNNLKVRQALCMAVDRKAIADACFPPGVAEWNVSLFVSPKYAGYIPYDELPLEGKKVRTYDSVAAKALLTEAGYPDGFKTKIQYQVAGELAWAEDGLLMVQDYWDAIGVELEIVPVDSGTMSSLRYAPFPYEAILGCAGGIGVPYLTLTGKYVTGSPWNRACISDPVIDKALEDGVAEFDPEKRNKIYKDVEEYILEQCTDLTMPQASTYSAWWPWFKEYNGEGSIDDGTLGGIFAHIWLDQDLREEMTGRR